MVSVSFFTYESPSTHRWDWSLGSHQRMVFFAFWRPGTSPVIMRTIERLALKGAEALPCTHKADVARWRLHMNANSPFAMDNQRGYLFRQRFDEGTNSVAVLFGKSVGQLGLCFSDRSGLKKSTSAKLKRNTCTKSPMLAGGRPGAVIEMTAIDGNCGSFSASDLDKVKT